MPIYTLVKHFRLKINYQKGKIFTNLILNFMELSQSDFFKQKMFRQTRGIDNSYFSSGWLLLMIFYLKFLVTKRGDS